jgi:hypothetical protein
MALEFPRTTEVLSVALRDAGAGLGFEPLQSGDMSEFRALASRLMQCDVAPAAVFNRARRRQPAAVLVRSTFGRMTGLVATLLLSDSAEARLLANRFDGLHPDAADLADPSDTPALYYVWGVAGEDREDRRAAMALTERLRADTFSDLFAYMRPATEAGRSAGERIGFRPAGPSPDSIYVSPPTILRQVA